jgi:hypothetical protein
MQVEFDREVRLARAAVRTADTLQTYFWSTLPAARELTADAGVGRAQVVGVPHFDAKGDVDAYIKRDAVLNAKTGFLLTGFYASKFRYPPFTPVYSVCLSFVLVLLLSRFEERTLLTWI